MIPKKNLLIVLFISGFSFPASAQRLNVGVTFQYHILKQVKVHSDIIEGTHSYSQYNVIENDWKFFSAGQSIVIGTVLQWDYKQFYAVIEPSFDLNTYNYTVHYPRGPDFNERLNFQILFLQADVPCYVGYQFGSGRFVRYSFFGGVVAVLPYGAEFTFQSREIENPQWNYFHPGDLHNIIYNEKKYLNGLGGFSLHFAHLGKVDLRYQHRLGSPGDKYKVSFNTVGVGITYYLPVNLKKKKIYYEE